MCTVRFSNKNSTFCPHNAFMVGFNHWTVCISLHIIWWGLVTETECVLRTAWYEVNLTIYFSPWFRRLIAGLSPWKPGFDARSVHVRFVMALGQVFLQVLWFSFPCQYHSTSFPCSFSSPCCFYQQNNGRRMWAFQKAVLFRKAGNFG